MTNRPRDKGGYRMGKGGGAKRLSEYVPLVPTCSYLKGEFTFFFIRELDVPPLEESNSMGLKKFVEVKFSQ